jgi:hypothetical protein
MLRITQLKTKLLAPLVLMAAGLCACMEDEVMNFDTLDKEVMVGGSISLPLGHSKITMQQVLDQYANRLENIDLRAGTGDVLTLYIDSLINYKASDLSDGIATLVSRVMKYNVETPPIPVPSYLSGVPVPSGIELAPPPTVDTFNFNGLNDSLSRQQINRLVINKATMKVHIVPARTYLDGFLKVRMVLPGDAANTWRDFGSITGTKDTTFSVSNLTLKADGSAKLPYQVEMKVTGNGQTSISSADKVNITVTVDTTVDFDYEVYGYFFYQEKAKEMMEPYNVNLFEYFPEGTKLGLCDPTITFNIESNLGVPLTLSIDSLVPEHRTPTIYPALKVKHQDLLRASTPDDKKQNTIAINSADFDDPNNISRLFNSDLKSIFAKYRFNPTYTSLASLPPAEQYEQFIASNSVLTMTMSAEIPLYLDEASQLRFTDTMDIDLNFGNDYAVSGNVELLFTVENALPIGVDTLKFTLLDSLYSPIPVSDPGDYRFDNLLPPDNSLDSNYEVDEVYPYTNSIKFNEKSIDELAKAKHLLVTVVARRPEGGRIKLTTKNYLDIKISVRGSISAKGKVDAL